MKALRIKEVENKLGIRKSKIYLLVKEGRLPKPAKIGSCSVWIESELDSAFSRLIKDQNPIGKHELNE